MTTLVRRTAAAGAALAALLALAGCGGSGGADEPDASPSSSAGDAGDSPTESPSADAGDSPSATPASGIALTYEALTVHAPEGWKRSTGTVSAPWLKSAIQPGTAATLLTLDQLPSLNEGISLEEAAQKSIETAPKFLGPSKLTMVGTVVLDDVEFYRIEGTIQDGDVFLYEFGGQVGGQGTGDSAASGDVTIAINLDKWAYPDKAGREALVDEILASVQIDSGAL